MAKYPIGMPYDDIKVYDQSVYNETSVQNNYTPQGLVVFQPIISEKGVGKDNELRFITSREQFEGYGKPNMKKYGLSHYLADNVLKAGANLLTCRLVADHAEAASMLVLARYSIQNSIGAVTIESAPYSDWEKYRDALKDAFKKDAIDKGLIGPDGTIIDDKREEYNKEYKKSDHYKLISMMDKADVDDCILDKAIAVKEPIADGEYIIPLFVIRSKAKGKFGNNISIKLYNDLLMDSYAKLNDSENNTRFYSIEVFDGDAKVQDTVTFSFDDYIYNKSSLHYSSVLYNYNSIEIEAYNMFYKAREYFTMILNNGLVGPNASKRIKASELDILFGVDYRNRSYTDEYYGTNGYAVTVDENVFNGNTKLGNGSDGEFENIIYREQKDGETVTHQYCDYDYNNAEQDPFAPYFKKAFSGELPNGDIIFDEVRMPFRMIFSPSLNEDVNNAIHKLVKERYSTAAFYGFPTDKTSYRDNRYYKVSKYSSFDTYKEYFISESAIIRDENTHKRIRMPSVYFNSYAVPNHWIKKKGKQFAGSDFAWTNYVNSTLSPTTIERQEYINNHNSGLNTMIENGKHIANPYEQITAQTPLTNSMLSELSYSICLLEMCYIALEYARERRWTSVDEENIEAYKTELLKRFKERVNSWYKSCEIEIVQASATGAGRNRLICKIYVAFKDILKGVTHEIYSL